jgi:ATP-dependent Clp protease protease subunit
MELIEDFRKFAIDKTKIAPSVIDDKIKNMVYPTIIEERDSAMRVSEMNVFSRLIQDRILFLSGQVDSLSMDTMIAQMLYLNSVDNRDISLYVNSPGGDVLAGLSLIDTMNFIESDVSTICLGDAASMGAFLLSGGTKGKRLALPNSRIMIHQPLGGAKGQATDIEIEAKEILRMKTMLNTLLAEHTGQKLETIKKDTERDNFMTAQEALEYGLIDKVVTNRK